MANVPWPDSVWIRTIGLQARDPGQVVRRSPGAGPHNPNPPRFAIRTTIRNQDTREMNLFLNSLGGASQIVDLPFSGPNVLMPIDDNYADDGEWDVSSAQLDGRFLNVTVVARAGVDLPPAGAPVMIGSATETRLAEVHGATDATLHLNPRRDAPAGTTRLFRASVVPVRLDTTNNPSWGDRDIDVAGGYPGTALQWVEG